MLPTTRTTSFRAALVLVCAWALLATAPAGADPGGAAFESPEVTALKCGTGDAASCPRGAALRVSGENLAKTRRVVFLGGRGHGDDRAARPEQSSAHRVLVNVPASAKTGPLRVETGGASADGPRLRVLRRTPARPL